MTIIKVSTIVDFYVVLEEDGVYSMRRCKPWLSKSHVEIYWGKGYVIWCVTWLHNYLGKCLNGVNGV
jgi:hypothetical protein